MAVGRNRILLVDEIPQGEVPIYDLDIPEFGAVVVAARGTAPVFQANIRRITFPTFPIAVNHTLKWEELQIRRYPAFDRAKERSAIALAIAEDDEVMRVTKQASELGVNPVIATATAAMVKSQLAKAFGVILGNQLVVGTVLMHPKRYEDVLNFSTTDFDQVSVNTIIETGLFGVIFGARLLITTRVPLESVGGKGSVYVITTPDKFGRIPERKAVEVKIFDNIPLQRYDVVFKEATFTSDSVEKLRKFGGTPTLISRTIPSQALPLQGIEGVETRDGATQEKQSRRTGKYITCSCGRDVYKAAWELRSNTSGKNFCSKKCANIANAQLTSSYQKNKSEVTRKKLSLKLLGHPVSVETRKKMGLKGETHPNWRGGVQYQPYPFDFNPQLKAEIRHRDNYTCQLCSLPESALKQAFHKNLTVHHIDYNKSNCSKSNLITLCRQCNSKVNFSTQFYSALFTKRVECIVRATQRCVEVDRNAQPSSQVEMNNNSEAGSRSVNLVYPMPIKNSVNSVKLSKETIPSQALLDRSNEGVETRHGIGTSLLEVSKGIVQPTQKCVEISRNANPLICFN